MYNTRFICTYNLHDDDEIQDEMYRIDFLNAFELKEYNDKVIMEITENTYNKLENNIEFKQLLENHHYFYINSETKIPNYEFVFQNLFAFDTFYLFHKCLIQLLNNKSIDQDIKIKLYDIFNKNKNKN